MRAPALFLSLVLCAPTLLAQDVQKTHDITLEDYFTQADISQVSLSPDGKLAAYTEGRWQESTDDRKADLWVVEVASGKSRRLTHDRCAARSPLWTLDGQSIYFLANRKREGEKLPPFNGKAQVWRVSARGGDVMPVTQVAEGIEAFALCDVANVLFFQVNQEKIQDDWAGLRAKFKHLEYGHGIERLSQIWALNLDSFRSRKVVDNGRNIREFTATPDGASIAMITTPDDKVVSFEGQSRVDVFDVKARRFATVPEGAYRKDLPSPYPWLEHPAWSPNGRFLAFNAIFDGYPAEIMIVDFQSHEPRVSKLPRPAGLHVKGYGSPLQWHDESTLCFLGEEKARTRLTTASGIGTTAPAIANITPGDVVVESFSLQKGHDPIILLADPRNLADIFTVPAKGASPRKITNVNPQAAAWKIPQLSTVSWKGAGGAAVEGILELPHDYKPGRKIPLVVEIHGGPTTASYFKLQYWIYGRTLLPAKGYSVLCPNYRGSTGYGDKFTTDLLGRENDLDVTDILKGVDHLVELGIADPDKLAVSGWSNGGYLTNCIITKTPRFKAAISGAGIIDAVMEWGSNDEPAYTTVFKQGFPWNAADKYHKASPTYHLDKIRTPTLIHVGANDERCPPGHSRTLYRTLKEYVHVPTELVVYPGEGHGIMKYKNRRAKMEWDLAWLEKYVVGRTK